jgi:hypothetical protein
MSRAACALIIGSLSLPVLATGVRSFIALPVEQGGQVLRVLAERDDGRDLSSFNLNAAYGITSGDTLLFGLPLRWVDGGQGRDGPVSLLYRRTLWRRDQPSGTTRFASLIGVAIPVEGGGSSQVPIGAVFTHYRGRTQWDVDALWLPARGASAARGRYDIAWDYRIAPAVYPDWGQVGEWHLIAELSGRYQAGVGTRNRLLAAGRYVRRAWLLEFGVDREVGGGGWGAVLGFRMHL